ncbi:hypothetical protein HMPREF0083_04511 [Aneurinibacillus aneurinilyticus ATCC 12856]|uniref:Uncharacterized protein n=1 Tax=Aneurinibacillus aneurinilyticus ATCC 12856 TaxID=649747 RepID=U1WXI4_ANEAE|nr:hypothetical protein HMPREF0083_04511 [Aneurinibacillus aneurinilyticus ATCC 12856]
MIFLKNVRFLTFFVFVRTERKIHRGGGWKEEIRKKEEGGCALRSSVIDTRGFI